MIAYIFKSSLSLIILFGLYWFLLRKEKLFVFNRFFLISSIVFSLAVPFVSIPVNLKTTPELATIIPASDYIFQPVNSEEDIPGPVQNSQLNIEKPALPISITEILIAIYILGVLLLLIRFFKNIFHIIQKHRLSEKISFKRYNIVLINDKSGPYCFFRSLFLNSEEYKNGRIDKELICHELEHIRQSHTIDILILELLKIFYWFNPMHLLYDRAIRLNHEYLADNGVIDEIFDMKSYANKLVSFISGKNNLMLTSGSNQSFIKSRLLMLAKAKSRSQYYGIRIFIILCIILFYSFAISFRQITPPMVKMSFVPQGQFTTNIIRGADTSRNRIVSVGVFYMSNEITNKEFREFVDWAENNPKDSIYQVQFNVAQGIDGKTGGIKKTYVRNVTPVCVSQILKDIMDKSALFKLDNKYKDYFTDRKYDDYPVVGVSKKIAEYYCFWKTDLENKKRKEQGLPEIHAYRLPIEMEWEYAAQRSNPKDVREKTLVSIQKSEEGVPNILGLTHLDDNVSEWVNALGENSVVRGGSWKTNSSIPDRKEYNPNYMDGTIGFRIVQSYISPEQEKEAKAVLQSRKLNSKSVTQETRKGNKDTMLIYKEYTKTDTITNILKRSSVAITDSDTAGKKVSIEHADNFGYKNDKDVLILVGNVALKYGDIEIKADSIVLNKRTNQLFASVQRDKSGKIIGKVVFKEGAKVIDADELTYNFKTHKGQIKNAITDEKKSFDNFTSSKNEWWYPIVQKHKIDLKQFNYKNIFNVETNYYAKKVWFEIGNIDSINKHIIILKDATYIIKETNDTYWIVISELLIHDLDNQLIEWKNGEMASYSFDNNRIIPIKRNSFINLKEDVKADKMNVFSTRK
jgi:beta-lactamase regulating signal transducer with metallopeptidase domain